MISSGCLTSTAGVCTPHTCEFFGGYAFQMYGHQTWRGNWYIKFFQSLSRPLLPLSVPHSWGPLAQWTALVGRTWQESLRPTVPWNYVTQGTRIHAKQQGNSIAAPSYSISSPLVRTVEGRSVNQLPEQIFTRHYDI